MVDAARDVIQLQPRFIDAIQQRYELIRPLVLFDEGTPAERAQATNTHPETMRTLLDQFQTQGMLGLALPETDVVPPDQPHRVPEAVRQEIARLKALYPGFHYRELARILFCTFGYRFHHRTVKHHWEQSHVPVPQQLDLWPYHLLATSASLPARSAPSRTKSTGKWACPRKLPTNPTPVGGGNHDAHQHLLRRGPIDDCYSRADARRDVRVRRMRSQTGPTGRLGY